jgi:predicted RND superfamily exporter protein
MGIMTSEIWQFLGVLALAGVAIVLWLFIIFLPGRTLENWSGGRQTHGKHREDTGQARTGELSSDFEGQDSER